MTGTPDTAGFQLNVDGSFIGPIWEYDLDPSGNNAINPSFYYEVPNLSVGTHTFNVGCTVITGTGTLVMAANSSFMIIEAVTV